MKPGTACHPRNPSMLTTRTLRPACPPPARPARRRCCSSLATARRSPRRGASIDDMLRRRRSDGRHAAWTSARSAATEQQPDGYDVDVARLLAKYLGVSSTGAGDRAEPHSLPADRQGRHADRHLRHHARTRQAGACSPSPTAASTIVLWRARATKTPGRRPEGAQGRRGPRQHAGHGADRDRAAGHAIMRFDDDATAAQALLSGQVDATARAPPSLSRRSRRTRPRTTSSSRFTLRRQPERHRLRRGQIDLLQWVNTFIYSSRTTASGRDLPQVARDARCPNCRCSDRLARPLSP